VKEKSKILWCFYDTNIYNIYTKTLAFVVAALYPVMTIGLENAENVVVYSFERLSTFYQNHH